MRPKTIALFGGSFDPPHHGHIYIASALQEMLHLDMIYVIPAAQNPLKPSKTLPLHRLQMTKKAFRPLSFCRVLDLELDRPLPSFAIDTIDFLLQNDPSFQRAKRFYIIGSDLIEEIHKWKDPERLFSCASPLVIPRAGFPLPKGPFSSCVVDIPSFPVSSTDIRKRIRKGLYCGHLVPQPVLAYIMKNHLYEGL